MSKKRNSRPSSNVAAAISITTAEWRVMELLWEQAPQTSQEIVAQLEQIQGWKRATVVTLLSRLAAKGALNTEPQANRFLYTPAVERSACVTQETQSFHGRMFGGTLLPLVAHVAEHQLLSKKDIAELKALLDQIKPKQ